MIQKFTFLLISLVLFSCGREEKFIVEGKVSGAPEDTKIFFNRMKVSNTIALDSSTLGKKSTFRFKSRTRVPDFYQLSLEGKKFITIIAKPGDRITIETSYDNFHKDYEIEGSSETELIRDLNRQISRTRSKVDSLTELFNKIKAEPGNEARLEEINNEYLRIIESQRKASVGFVIRNYNSLASVVALYQEITPGNYVFYSSKDLQYFKIVSDSLSARYPNTPHVKSLVTDFHARMEEMKQSTTRRLFENARETIPELKIPNIKGDTISLLGLDDKYILLSFTSSGCFECRLENLDLIEVYNKYHRRGFEIYQVSLDTVEAAWVNSVRKDNLPWITVSEMELNNSYAAKIYNINQIPSNYLIGPEKDIIGKNLFGKALENKLKEVF